MTDEKLHKQLLSDLADEDEGIVLEAVKAIRESGTTPIVEPLMRAFFSTPFEQVKKEIFKVFCDLKDSHAAIVIAENIADYASSPDIDVFLSALWQSAIRFETLHPFVDIFVAADLKTAIESMTLIEQNCRYLSDTERLEHLNALTDYAQNCENFKKSLTNDLLEILKID